MSKNKHFIFILLLSFIILAIVILLSYYGISFYNISIEERFFHPLYRTLKPSGTIGHGLGIIGSLFMLIGVLTYMLRKRYRIFSRFGLLKHWLEFHIFLCTLGPILVLFHTSFKFGGIVAISFWSMIAVFLSGILGRFIYIQIPRSIEGRELSLSEVKNLKTDIKEILNNVTNLDESSYNKIIELTNNRIGEFYGNVVSGYLKSTFEDRRRLVEVKSLISNNRIPKDDYNKIVKLVKNEISLNRKIERLNTMQNLLKYWHVAHLPFAFVMLIVMIIHVVITLLFGYKWIF